MSLAYDPLSPQLNPGVDQPKRKRIAAVDGLRALAMLLVFSFHVWEFSDKPTWMLNIGSLTVNLLEPLAQNTRVDLFIVISGFCLFLPICLKPDSLNSWNWRDYAKRRIRRIVPAYYAALVYAPLLPIILVVVYLTLGMQASWQPFPDWWQFATHLTFTHMLFLDTWDGINGSLWTMSLEAQFYVLFPLIVLLYRKIGLWTIGLCILLSVVYRMISGAMVQDADWQTRFLVSSFSIGRLMQFSFGMLAMWLVAKYYIRGNSLPNWMGWAMLGGTLLFYLVAVSSFSNNSRIFPVREMALGIAFFFLVTSVCATNIPVKRIFESKIMSRLGYMSYSIFLLHQPTAWYISEFLKKNMGIGGDLRFILLLTVGFAFTVGVAYLFFLVFEKPFIGGPKKGKAQPTEPARMEPLPTTGK